MSEPDAILRWPSPQPQPPTARRAVLDRFRRRSALGAALVILGGALLLASSVLHLVIWAEFYRDVNPIGLLIVVQGIAALVLALVVISLRSLGWVAAGAIFLALSTIALLVIGGVEAFGYDQSLSGGYAAGLSAVQTAGFIALATAAGLLRSSGGRKAKPSRTVGGKADGSKVDEPSDRQPALDMAALSQSGIIRWPADRPHPVTVTSATRPVEEPARKPTRTPKRTKKQTSTPQPERDATPEPEPAQELSSAPQAYQEPEPEPEPERAADWSIAPQPDLEPAQEKATTEPEAAAAPASAPAEPTFELEEAEEPAAEAGPAPEGLLEPIRGMLVRELQSLDQLEQTLGPDAPDTLIHRSNIAYYYRSAGEIGYAAYLQEAVLADTVRILGEAHPHSQTARKRLAEWRKLAKKKGRSKASVPG